MLERPNTQFAIYRSPTVGDNQAGGIGAMVLAGSRIRGVIVDNPSGSWVKLSGTGLGFEPYIAPYTLAWSVSLLPSVLEISAAYVMGPTGQASSTAGSPIVVYLFEAQVPSSGGSTFIDSQAEQGFTVYLLTATVAGVTTILQAGVAGKRYRVTYAAVKHKSDDTVNVLIQDTSGMVNLFNASASPASNFKDAAYPNGGFDLPLGSGLQIITQSLFSAVPVDVLIGSYLV